MKQIERNGINFSIIQAKIKLIHSFADCTQPLAHAHACSGQVRQASSHNSTKQTNQLASRLTNKPTIYNICMLLHLMNLQTLCELKTNNKASCNRLKLSSGVFIRSSHATLNFLMVWTLTRGVSSKYSLKTNLKLFYV